MISDQTSGQFLGALKNLAQGFLQWVGQEGQEREHPQGVVDARSQPARHAAGAMLIAPDGRSLFLRRAKTQDHAGQWAFPGGMGKDNETPADTAMRECREEIGDCGLDARGMAHIDTGATDAGGQFHTFAHPVRGAFKPTLDGEHDNYQWANIKNPPQPLHPGVADTLKGFATDPLTEKGQKIMSSMKKQYGGERGERVFYASKNAGRISGVDQNRQTSIEAGGWRSPNLTEPGNARVPRTDSDKGGSGWRSPSFTSQLVPDATGKPVGTRAAGQPAPPPRAPAGSAGAPAGRFKALPPAKGGDMRAGWRSPGFGRDFDAGTPEGAQKAAQTRAAGGGSFVPRTNRYPNYPAPYDDPQARPKPRESREFTGYDYGTSQGAQKAAQTRGGSGAPRSGVSVPYSRMSAAPSVTSRGEGGVRPQGRAEGGISRPGSGGWSSPRYDAAAGQPEGAAPSAANPQRFKLYDSQTGQSYPIDQPLHALFGDNVTEDDLNEQQQMAGMTPEQQYHAQAYKMKQRDYDHMLGQTPPPMYHEKHQQALNALQRDMLDHAQKGGFSHKTNDQQPQQGMWQSPSMKDAAPGAGGGTISTDPIEASAMKPPTAKPQAVRPPSPIARTPARSDWQSPRYAAVQ